MKNPIAAMNMSSGKKIIIELEPKCAPNSVNCFISLINKGVFIIER